MARRKKAEREQHLVIIAERYIKGDYQADIAKDLDVSQVTVSNDLKELHKRWKDRAFEAIDEQKARELARIDHLELEYWKAWTRSQEAAETRVTEKVAKKSDGKSTDGSIKEQERLQERVGDPRFLQGVERCVKMRIDLVGLEAPKKMDLDHKSDGQPMAATNVIMVREIVEEE